MRILFVTPYYHPEFKFGGPPKRIHSLSIGLRRRGHEVSVITFDSERPAARCRATYDGITVQYIPWLGWRLRQMPTRTRELHSAMQESDIVHSYGLYNLLCPLAGWLASRHSVPFLLEPMGMFVPRVASIEAKKIFHALVIRPMARKAARIVATSALEFDELRSLAPSSKLVLRRNGVDLISFRDLPPRNLMRNQWRIPAESKLVLYLGRISRKKNLLELVHAFDEAGLADAHLVIAGPVSETDYFGELQREISHRTSAKRIILREPVYGDELRAALSAADLFVLPSLNENFGNSAAEAVAANVPVLLTDTCGIAPIIHGRAGLAIPLGVAALTEGLVQMLDPDFRRRMTEGREDVKRELSWDEPIQQTEELYERVIAEGKRG
jgi:glycosyltransferase involved in cell wall biosynthesis